MAPERRRQPLAPCEASPPRKLVPFHHPFKSAPFGDANGIDKIALRKNGRADDVARFDRQGEITKLADAFGRRARRIF